MANGFFKNVFDKYFSKKNPLTLIKVSMTIIAIFIYIWFFCLIALLYNLYRVVIYKIIEYSPVGSLFHYTIGYGGVLSPLVFLVDAVIFNQGLMKLYAGVFGALTLLIIVVLAFWFIIKNIIFVSWMAYVWPFDELVEVFNIILRESPFTNFAITNLLRLLKLFLSLFEKKEKFQNKLDMASIIKLPYLRQKIYITELQKNLYNKAKQHYEKKETYMVDVMKVREHTTAANILKNLSIITSENDIASANIANLATTFDVGIKVSTKI